MTIEINNGRIVSVKSAIPDTVSDIVENWDLGDCVTYCNDKLEKEYDELPIEDIIAIYEERYGKSIVEAIVNWNDCKAIGGKQPDWHSYYLAVCYPVKESIDSFDVPTEPGDNKAKGWVIYLVTKLASLVPMLVLETQTEAELVTQSINTHYFRLS